MGGELAVLSVGAGDLRLEIDDDADAALAADTIETLLRQGYAIVIEDEDGVARVVESFDPERREYLVAAAPPKREPERYVGEPIPVRRGLAEGTGSTDPAPVSTRARWKKNGAWARVDIDGYPAIDVPALRHSEAQTICERVNAGEDPKSTIESVLRDRRRPVGRSRATAIAPTAGG